MSTLYTVTDAATSLGRQRDVVRRVAARNNIGTWIGGRLLLTADEIERIRQTIRPKPGQPRKVIASDSPATRRKSNRSKG